MEPVLFEVTPFVQDPTGRKGSISLKKAQERSGLLMRSINALREEGFATDFELRVENERIPVHRLVLAASSSYFKAMLGHDMKESNQGYVDIKGLDGKSVKACIDYLYSGTIELDGMKSVEQVLQACDLLQVNDLKQSIFKYLSTKINSKSCLYVRKCALTYNAQQSVVQTCDSFLATNLATVACSNEWGHLSMEEVSHFIGLSKDKTTSRLWATIVNWVEKDRLVRSEVLLDLLQLIIKPRVHETRGIQKVMYINTIGCMLQSRPPFDFDTIITDIVGHPLVAEKEDCMSFLLKTVIEPHIHDVARYVKVTNCFDLNSLSKRFQSESLCAMVRSFMTQNFPALSNSERIKDLDDGDFTFLMKNARNGTEEQKYNALATWTKNTSRKGDFIELFSQLDLTRLSLDFIQNVVRKNRIVKQSPQCNDLITDSFYNRAKSFETRSAAAVAPTSRQVHGVPHELDLQKSRLLLLSKKMNPEGYR